MLRPSFLLLCTLTLFACSKKDTAIQEDAGSASQGTTALAYQESVRAGMDNLKLVMSFLDENNERQQWDGTMTMVKDRFATVEHPTSQQKEVHLRRWANVHIAEIPSSGEPRANRTENSPLSDQQLIADRMNGTWKHRFVKPIANVEMEQRLAELDRVEAGVAAFYEDHKLAVGETWQVPATAMVRWFGDEVEGFSGDINVRVDRLDTDQDHACAVLGVSFKTTGRMKDPDGQFLDMELEAAGEIWRATEIGEDLKVAINGTVSLKAAVATRQIQMNITGPVVITEERKLKR